MHLTGDASSEAARFVINPAQGGHAVDAALAGTSAATIQSAQTAMYINLCGGRGGEGVYLQMWDNPWSEHSQWLLEPVGPAEGGVCTIRSAHSGMCVQVEHMRGEDWVRTTADEQNPASHWSLEAQPAGGEEGAARLLRSVAFGKCLALHS